jgi:HEPN domain-containing protein
MSAEKVKKEAARWLAQAKEDFVVAELLGRESKFAQSCFYSQQSAEKALKGLWYYHDCEPWGHSVCRLIEEFEKEPLHTTLMQLHEETQLLDRFYIPTRYPNGLPELIPQDAYNKTDAKAGLSASKKIIDFVVTEIEK